MRHNLGHSTLVTFQIVYDGLCQLMQLTNCSISRAFARNTYFNETMALDPTLCANVTTVDIKEVSQQFGSQVQLEDVYQTLLQGLPAPVRIAIAQKPGDLIRECR